MKQAPCPTRRPSSQLHLLALFLCFGLLAIQTACRTVPEFATVDFTQPGWKIKSGQAVWRVKKDAPEIAGELLFATKSEPKAPGHAVLQMTKTPFPMVVAQHQWDRWQIEFPTEKKRYSGRGEPPKRLAWLHLANALSGGTVEKPWQFHPTDSNSWRLENSKTGETIEGFLE